MTVCNMSIEGGARAGMVAPDDTTFAYVDGKPHAPKDAAWEQAVDHWRSLATDDGAAFDTEVTLDATSLQPYVSWGTNPAQSTTIDGSVPAPSTPEAERALTTDNADDLITTLTRGMIRARQAEITQEIMEIVGGAEALR